MKLASLSRRRTVGALTFLPLSGLCAATLTPAQAQAPLTTVASFTGTNGANPFAAVTFDSNGNLFGTTRYGGANNDGTVYEIAEGSTTITTLASFTNTNGANPAGGVVFDSRGNLFGTTFQGGAANNGTVYEIAKGSTDITTLAAFNGANGRIPYGGVTIDSQGNLFGTTSEGGASYGATPGGGFSFGNGTVYELAKGSTAITNLAFFTGANGASPNGGVTFDSSGNLFGTTVGGANNDYGTVYEIAKGNTTLTTLTTFSGANGINPFAGVTFDGSGNLFGATFVGGANGAGTVFEIAGAGSPAAVPEASTTISLGLLLTLGLGGIVLARRKRTQNAAPAV